MNRLPLLAINSFNSTADATCKYLEEWKAQSCCLVKDEIVMGKMWLDFSVVL